MDLSELNKIEQQSRSHKSKSDRLLAAKKDIADLRGNGMKRIMDELTKVIVSYAHPDEKREAKNDLASALEKAWPDLCRQIELKLIAKARIQQNRSKMLQVQIDSFFPAESPDDD